VQEAGDVEQVAAQLRQVVADAAQPARRHPGADRRVEEQVGFAAGVSATGGVAWRGGGEGIWRFWLLAGLGWGWEWWGRR
jgi:hypothetical protein